MQFQATHQRLASIAIGLVAVFVVFAADSTQAQQHAVSFSTISGSPGHSVEVNFDFTNSGGVSALEARARILPDTSAFSAIDVSGLCAQLDADFRQCGLNDDNRLVIVATNFDARPLGSASGKVVFTIAPDAEAPQTIDIEWNSSVDSGTTFTPTETTDGQIRIQRRQHGVSFSSASGVPGQTIALNFSFINPGGSSALESRARILPDVSAFSSIDLSALCAGIDADFRQCALNDGNRLVILATNFDATKPIAEGGGTLSFTIDPQAPAPQTIDIEWDSAADQGLTFTPSETVDGRIEIVESLAPVRLSFASSPRYGVVGGGLFGEVIVHVLDPSGNLFVDDSTTVVEIRLETDPTGLAQLSGSAQATVSNGVAVFPALSINRVGNGFRLSAQDQSGELDSSVSDAFNIVSDEILQDRFEGRESFRDCPECPTMVMIPSGSFTQGSPLSEPQSLDNERPQRNVNVPSFAISQTEVTFGEWDACAVAGGCSHNPGDNWGRGNRPVIFVSWNDAQRNVKLAEQQDWPHLSPAVGVRMGIRHASRHHRPF